MLFPHPEIVVMVVSCQADEALISFRFNRLSNDLVPRSTLAFVIVHPLTRQLSLTGLYLSILISLVKKVDLRFNSNARLTIGSILYKNTRIILSNGSQMAAHVSILF